jgi:cyclohexanone monooxygenase
LVRLHRSIHQPHVELVTDHIKKITKDGIVTVNDRLINVDRIISATGFDTTFKPKYPFQGRDGRDLGDVWAKRPKGRSSERRNPVHA